MRRLRKKMLLMCTIACICAGVLCTSSCALALMEGMDVIGSTAGIFFVVGAIDGAGEAIKENNQDGKLELKTGALIEEWWNNLPFVEWLQQTFGTETPEVEEEPGVEEPGSEDSDVLNVGAPTIILQNVSEGATIEFETSEEISVEFTVSDEETEFAELSVSVRVICTDENSLYGESTQSLEATLDGVYEYSFALGIAGNYLVEVSAEDLDGKVQVVSFNVVIVNN